MEYEHEALGKAAAKMEKTIDAINREFINIRAGRANPKILDKVMVDYYGTMTPIPQVGNVATPEPRMLTLSLWDQSMMKEVEKAILASDIGITPSNDGKVIRLVFPDPTEERRQELAKVAKKKAEEGKVSMRAVRRDTIEQLKKEKKASEITEDDYTVFEKKMQDITDKYIKKLEDLLADKEKEIMEI